MVTLLIVSVIAISFFSNEISFYNRLVIGKAEIERKCLKYKELKDTGF